MADPIVINNWQLGIAPSPHLGFGDMRNIDIKTVPGVAMINYEATQASPARIASQTFTANVNDNITFSTSIPALRAVTVSSTGTLPAGLAASTIYYTITAGTTTKLATSLANAESATAIDITNTGSGTHSIVTVNMGIPYWVVKSPNNGHYWLLDSTGRLWSSRSTDPTTWYLISGNTTLGAGDGLVWWKNYVLVWDDTGVSAFGPTTSAFGSQAWTNSGAPFITSMTSATWHSAIVGQDDIVYYCNDRYVGSLQENGTFAGTAGTTTSTLQALDLPSNYATRCLVELGTNILIGTSNGVNENTMKIADIFPWDRTSSSFDIPIRINEYGIKSMLNKQNTIYVLAGVEGDLYTTNGSSANHLIKIPLAVTGLFDNTSIRTNLTVNPSSLTEHNGKVVMGIGGSNGSDNSKASGVWSYDPQTGALMMEHLISSASYGGDTGGGTNGVTIGGVWSADQSRLVIGWNDPGDADVSGADYTHGVNRYDGSEAYIDSPVYIVGTKKKPVTFSDVQADFGRALVSGDSVVIQYRTNISGSYTTLATFNTSGDVSAESDAGALSDVTTLQIRTVLNNSLGGNKTPWIKEVRLIPTSE